MPDTRVPGPAGLPLIGSLLDLKRDPLGTYLAARRDHGDVIRVQAGPPGLRAELWMVFSPEGAQQVLATESANFRKDNVFYGEIRASFGNGLLTAQDADYLRQRRLVQPLFTRKRVDHYADAIATETDALAARWADAPDGTVDLAEEMNRFALRTVSRILFGQDVEEAVETVHHAFPVLNGFVRDRGFSPLRLPRQWPLPSHRKALAAEKALYEVCDAIIARRTATGGEDPEGSGGDDLLGLLAAARGEDGEQLDATELREQVLIFLLAGHETTATSLTFALHLLGTHPEQQARAHREAAALLADGRRPTAADYAELPYLTQVLKETMRLYPAAPSVGRRAVAGTTIGGVDIPAGADVLVVPYVTHRHPGHWEDPERFDPERFTPEREAARHRYAWFPFGGGPRACIGQHFSMLEAVLALAVLLREFEVTAVDTDVPLGQGITLEVRGPVRVKLTPR
ncbi:MULTISPECIES: cytochrome P450 [Kitasatospora]|uniref:Putative cytochrome P450 n=1 Tax=Kitasatospora setae (strain ATCC 33774 / DSM 43861 / JCM 3304 / KCC A-0304 / NBRC 14216 / KM-6054) TaxID=452652 RepID=E4N1G6_KITSK|nr:MULTISPECIES: cytochrome P450 [Kitasatospora]BAJ32000.1 putative cytochrome P450 [Kitasatospora setae KM-6054]